MKIFGRNKLNPSWIFKPSGYFKIWRLFPSERDRIVCELRNVDDKIVKFACISSDDGKLLWEKEISDERWWVEVSDVDGDKVYICEFARPDFPVYGKFYAVSIENGEILWENSEHSFIFAFNGRVYTSKNLFEGRTYFEIDSETGLVLNQFGEGYVDSFSKIRKMKSQKMEYIETSIPFDEYFPDYEVFHPVVERYLSDADRNISPEVIVKGNLLVLNYHAVKEPKLPLEKLSLSSVLKVVNILTSEQIYEDVLYRNLSFYTQDNFFCVRDFLFYVKEQEELIAIKFSDGYESDN